MVAHDDPKSKGTAKATNDDLDREPVVDFNALPSEVVQSYVSFYDLASSYPPQDTSEADLASSSSGRKRKGRAYSPLPTTSSRKRTAAENSAVETAAALGANAKTNEDEIPCPPHFFDADAATNYLSQVATNHFASQPAPKEGEVVVGFLYKCRAKGELNRPLAHYKLSEAAAEKAQVPEGVAQRSR
ncbi:hypothetical protein PSEUBRA_004863 [Kalmanozyma brasiliensis GHG001]|uniref:Uncharacterized protein n=1 Tax=Kalmanozyma brasiliensis (strain GHG001) TaxID=1365824 RepID=V5GIL3_KALBG|nr:uncharacterized protein PSEUBRA_004863 [Kalmanozyma brasiliensis GHG001]EST05827.1 hypothetical protein PSEUBRA_004863 [Kalmanozyma brasiliensis GHG001]